VAPVKIMHFADVHFGVETYGKTDPETGLNSRLVDFRRSLEFAIDRALDYGVDLALFAGDAYKSRDPNQTHQREFAACIRRLTEAGVPVVMVTGNHDLPNARAKANAIEIYRTLGVTGVSIISRPEVLRIETKAGPVQVAGMPYLLRSNVLSREQCKNKSIQEVTDLMVRFYTEYINDMLVSQLDPSLPSVLLGHFWIKNATVSSQSGYLNVAEPEVLVSAVANPAFDYVAMGHIHKHQDLNKHASPSVVYCGSIDRIDFSERNEEKGFVLVELAKGATRYEFVPVPARRFVEIEVDAEGPGGRQEDKKTGRQEEPESDLSDKAPPGFPDDPTIRILAAIGKEDVADAVVKVRYHISREKRALVREAEIREALSDAFMIVSVSAEMPRDDGRTRNRLLNESLDPVQALDMFFESREAYSKRKTELMDYARPLIDELLAEEQVS